MVNIMNSTNARAILKEHYSKDRIAELIYKDHPFLALIKDEQATDAGGAYYVIPAMYAGPQGSAVASTAIANPGLMSYKQFQVSPKSNFNAVQVSGLAIAQSRKSEDAFVRVMTEAMDKVLLDNFRQVALFAFGDGTGVRGQISAGQTLPSNSLVLANAQDEVNFEVGQRLVSLSTRTATATQASGSDVVAVIQSINTGTLALDVAVGNFGSASWYIARQGDPQAVVQGVGSWIPTSSPSSGESFCNVDRSVQAKRLAGVRFDGSGYSIKTALMRGAAAVTEGGGRPNKCFLNFKAFANLQEDMLNQALIQIPGKGNIGFAGLDIIGPKGVITVIPDVNVPDGYAWLLDTEQWRLLDFGGEGVPHIVEEDGLPMLRTYNDDTYEVRAASYVNLACRAPWFNCVVTLPS